MPGDPIDGLIGRIQADSTASQELHGYFTESFELDQPLWRQYAELLARARAGRPRAEHHLRRLDRQRADLAGAPVHARTARARDRPQLHRREPGRRDGGAAEEPRQHRAPGRVRPHRDAVHVARHRPRLRRLVPLGAPPRLRRLRLLAPARVDVGVRAQLPQPLDPPVPHAVPRRVRRLGDRDAEPDHLRARGRVRELPAVARRPEQADPEDTPTAMRCCRRCRASPSRSARSWAARS